MIESMGQLVSDFASALRAIDARTPIARTVRSGVAFQPRIGPHSESATCLLVRDYLSDLDPTTYGNLGVSVPYAKGTRARCDLADPDWAVEVKMLRLFGDNGKANDNLLMHILSPYPQHRSALTDCAKLVQAEPRTRLGILIYAFDAPDWPMGEAIDAFETLASARVWLSERRRADFGGLIHPIHKEGAVFGWEVRRPSAARNHARLTTAGHGGQVVPGVDFSDNASVRAAFDEHDRRQLSAGE